jgi:sedoheptulokinase
MILGIDIGTTSVSAAILGEDGQVLYETSRPHLADSPAPPGRAEQDPRALWRAAEDLAAGLPSHLRPGLRAVGVTGQMHGVVLLDPAGLPVGPLVTWQDQRCHEDDFAARLAERLGRPLASGLGLATLAWLVEHDALPPGATVACTIGDWVAARLAGRDRPVTDPTGCASWGLSENLGAAWDLPAIAAAGVPTALLPAVVPSGETIGTLAAEPADAWAIPADIPVIAALGDNQASLLATLAEPNVELALTLGTGGQCSAVVDATVAAAATALPDGCELRPFPAGRAAVVASCLSGGSAWAMLGDAVRGWLVDLGIKPPPREALLARLNELGLSAEQALEVRPSFLGERHDPHSRGTIGGIGLHSFQMGPLARGLAEGIMTQLKQMLPPWAMIGRERVVGSGNALHRNPLLQQAAETVFALPLTLGEQGEEAAVGAALHAAEHARIDPDQPGGAADAPDDAADDWDWDE